MKIQEELAEEYDQNVAYQDRVKDLKLTKVDFVHQMSTSDETIDAARAERMWRHFSVQLESGSVKFLDNGTMNFALPLTHAIAPYLPDVVSDSIEACYLTMRSAYVQLPRRYRKRLESRRDWLIDSGAVHAMLVIILSFLVVDVGVSAVGLLRRKPEVEIQKTVPTEA